MPKIVLFKELWVLKGVPRPNIPGLVECSFNQQDLNSADAFLSMNTDNPYSLNARWRDPIFTAIKETGKPLLVMESPVFRKNLQLTKEGYSTVYRLGWDHYLANGKFNNKNSPSDRWEMFSKLQHLELKPLRPPNTKGNILIILQKPNDSSLKTMLDLWQTQEKYLTYVVDCIRKLYLNRIILRLHPLYKERFKINLSYLTDNIQISNNLKTESRANGGSGLAKDFEDTFFVFGYNSNTLIESVMEGIPTITTDPDAHSREVSVPLYDVYEETADRLQWVYDLSYTQWTLEELATTKPWDHLKGVYF